MARTSFRVGKSSNPSMTQDDIRKLIEKKSYELFEKRGKKSGLALEDWLEAERIIKGKLLR